jgi:hypothetical protein
MTAKGKGVTHMGSYLPQEELDRFLKEVTTRKLSSQAQFTSSVRSASTTVHCLIITCCCSLATALVLVTVAQYVLNSVHIHVHISCNRTAASKIRVVCVVLLISCLLDVATHSCMQSSARAEGKEVEAIEVLYYTAITHAHISMSDYTL